MRVVSLFSGAGVLDLGFIRAGHTVIWANDLYDDACRTYARNIGNHILHADISTIPSSAIPKADIVIGGFPCQGFSIANIKRHDGDPRNRLYREMLRVIGATQPRFFLAENVKGLLSLGRGEVFKQILSDFSSLGYHVQHQVLNAADFGVPQRRERVIIVGTRLDIPAQYQYPIPTHCRLGQRSGMPQWRSVDEAIAHFPDPDEGGTTIPNHCYSRFKIKGNGYLGHRKINGSMPAPCVTGRGDDRGGVVVLPHPNGKRRMTARELATIQDFPPDFVFEGSLTSTYRQIANAVPVGLAYAVAKQFDL